MIGSETLRPNGSGDYNNISGQYPNKDYHWDKVDEVNADDAVTYIYSLASSQEKDVYSLQDTSISGVIQYINVCFRAAGLITSSAYAQPFLRLSSVETSGDEVQLGDWLNYKSYVLRPGGGNWSTSDLNSLQVGIGLWGAGGASCTQLWIEIGYTTLEYEAPPVDVDIFAVDNNDGSLDDIDKAAFEAAKTNYVRRYDINFDDVVDSDDEEDFYGKTTQNPDLASLKTKIHWSEVEYELLVWPPDGWKAPLVKIPSEYIGWLKRITGFDSWDYWVGDKYYDIGRIVYVSAHWPLYVFECVQTGTSGGTEPDWVTVIDEVTYDGSVIWSCKLRECFEYGWLHVKDHPYGGAYVCIHFAYDFNTVAYKVLGYGRIHRAISITHCYNIFWIGGDWTKIENWVIFEPQGGLTRSAAGQTGAFKTIAIQFYDREENGIIYYRRLEVDTPAGTVSYGMEYGSGHGNCEEPMPSVFDRWLGVVDVNVHAFDVQRSALVGSTVDIRVLIENASTSQQDIKVYIESKSELVPTMDYEYVTFAAGECKWVEGEFIMPDETLEWTYTVSYKEGVSWIEIISVDPALDRMGQEATTGVIASKPKFTIVYMIYHGGASYLADSISHANSFFNAYSSFEVDSTTINSSFEPDFRAGTGMEDPGEYLSSDMLDWSEIPKANHVVALYKDVYPPYSGAMMWSEEGQCTYHSASYNAWWNPENPYHQFTHTLTQVTVHETFHGFNHWGDLLGYPVCELCGYEDPPLCVDRAFFVDNAEMIDAYQIAYHQFAVGMYEDWLVYLLESDYGTGTDKLIELKEYGEIVEKFGSDYGSTARVIEG